MDASSFDSINWLWAALPLLLLALAVGVNFTHSYSVSYNDGGTPISKTISQTSGAQISISETIAAAAADQLVAFAVTIAKIKMFFMVASAAITVETNSSSSPQETFSLVADVPIFFNSSDPGFVVGDIFAGNITALYATSTPGGNLDIRCLYDPT